METESESVDISSIKLRALAFLTPTAEQDQGSHDSHHIKAVQAALQKALSQHGPDNQAHYLGNSLDTTALPSTVPESEEIHVDFLAPLPPPPPASQLIHGEKMSSQNDATQELSPSELGLIISRSRSIVARADETQHTLNEGDEGHVDLASSFIPQEDGDEVEEPQIVDFSPTQSQHQLSQFPESQRFKTPATAGKKRDCSGNTKETPDLPPQRPDLRNDAPTPAHLLGLSQAFAATQAATSPFTNGIANPLSDRPSPNVDLEVRPATAATSSPLRPISEFRRATTEPASRYVPIAQSQADRIRRAQLNLPDDEESDDDFSEEPSLIRRQRRQREREERIKEKFRLMSSPTKKPARGSSAIKSSPVLAAQRSSLSPSPEPQARVNRHPPLQENLLNQDDADGSEAETEQEDENDAIGVNHRPMFDEEDKENDLRMVQIPQTTVRLQRVLNDMPSEVEASPSLRHGNGHGENVSPVAVANSQPSQPPNSSQRQQPKSSSAGGVDFVPQSQADPAHKNNDVPGPTETFVRDRQNGRIDGQASSHGEPNADQGRSSARAQLEGTIPETSSSRQLVGSTVGGQPATQAAVSRSMSNSNFETAPSRLPPPSSSRSKMLEMSSPPILTTPPGRKRKRMADISGGPSPQQSTQGFDPVEALHLDPQMNEFFDHSPVKVKIMKRRRVERSTVVIPEIHNTSLHEISRAQQTRPNHITDDEVQVKDTSYKLGASPQQPATIERAGLRRAKPNSSVRTRNSLWDLEVSPQKAAPPRAVSPKEPFPPTKSSTPRKATPHSTGRKAQPTQSRRSCRRATEALQRLGSEQVAETDGLIPTHYLAKSLNATAASMRDETPSEISRATPAEEAVAPDMVFACFNGKTRAYYPARCLEILEGDPKRYRVQWEGYNPDEVDAYGVKALDIRVGDQVKIDMKGFAKVPYVVRGFKEKVLVTELAQHITDIRGYRTILVAPKQRKSLPADVSTESIKEAPVSATYLDNIMWNQMKVRAFEFRSQVAQSVSTSGYATPLEQPSTPNTPSSWTRRQVGNGLPPPPTQNTDGIFANMVFAISYEDASRKNSINTLVRDNGGLMVRESFMELLQSDSAELKDQFANAGFTALLADKHSRKEKYMQALALSLPCLSGKWIEACVKADKILDWQTYLLPAGESDELDGAIRSRSMPPIDAANVRLVEMMQSRPRPLEGAKVAVMVGRRKTEGKRKPYLFLLQALGVENIRKIADLKAAKDLVGNSEIDWLFVEDRDVELARNKVASKGKKRATCKVAGNELIVQSLILGKLYHSM